ncbi:MAG: acyl carrier protein [Gemmatimonadetes bacterium]|nr:acyl carrier protein [Gemmatimonadota bacterium]
MGLDSVELVMAFEEAFDLPIPDEEAARLATPRMVVDYVFARVPTEPAGGCLTQRIFYQLRRGMRANAGHTGALAPATPLRDLTNRRRWPELWMRLRTSAADPAWPAEVPWSGFLREGPRTLADLARWIAVQQPLPGAAAPGTWTRERIELTVRGVVLESAGVAVFSLDDEFVRDMRID